MKSKVIVCLITLFIILGISLCDYEREVKVAEAQAKKLTVAADAEKKANELKQQALTPAILGKMWIEKWNGELPAYGQVPTLFKDISK